MIITNWLKEPSPFGTARLCDHLSVCFVLINLQQSMVKLPLSAQVGPVSRVAGHAKLCNLGGSGSSRRYADAPKQPGIRVPIHGQRERSKLRRGGEGEQVPPWAWKASLTNWSTPQEPLSSTRKVSQEALGHRPRGSQASEALVSASQENCTQCQTPARATSQVSGEEQETELEEATNTEQPGSSITSGTRQKACQQVIPDKSGVNFSRRLSKIDPCHTTKRRSQTLSCSSSRLSKPSLHITHPLLLVDEALGVQEKPRAARAQSGQ